MGGITKEWLEGEIAELEAQEKAAMAKLAEAQADFRRAKAARDQAKEDLNCHRAVKKELQWHLGHLE